MTSRFLVTICTYNERANILTLIPEIRRVWPTADILVIDDNSPDGTADEVRRFHEQDGAVDLLLRTEKAGLGAATIAGFQEGCRRNYEWLVNLDADWSHPPALLPDLEQRFETADVVVASRYVTGGGVQGWPWYRYVMSWGVNWYSRCLLGIRARDCSGAYRAYRVSKLLEIDFSRFHSRGYAFQEEMLYRCQSAGARIVEVPFVFVDREVGESKINGREVIRALRDIAWLGLGRCIGR